jgi:hypothetical protein
MASTLIAPDHVEYVREGTYRQPMLTMRQDQVDAFERYHLQKFEDEMVAHLKTFSPEHWQLLGEPDGRRVIRLGIEQAKNYGFTNRGPVRFYIELMFIFGSFFDTDPQYSWAREILIDSGWTDEMVHAERLHSSTMTYISSVFGPEHRYLIEAMGRLTRWHMANFVAPEVDMESQILSELQAIYPQKCDFLGSPTVRELIHRGFDIAFHYGFTTDKGFLVTALLAFTFGHGFYKDPLHGWIAKRLADNRWPTPEACLDELYSKSMVYVKDIS